MFDVFVRKHGCLASFTTIARSEREVDFEKQENKRTNTETQLENRITEV